MGKTRLRRKSQRGNPKSLVQGSRLPTPRVTLEVNEQITLNTERSRHEIELLNHPAFRVPKDSSRPSLAHVLQIVTAEPIADPLVISDSEAAQYLRQKVQVQGDQHLRCEVAA
jgi:hypothetical protein